MAVIGILAVIVLTSLNSARVEARITAAHESLKSAQVIAILCADEVVDLIDPSSGAPGTVEVCDFRVGILDTTWPELPDGWTYNGGGDYAVADATFEFSATHAVDGITITCDINACLR